MLTFTAIRVLTVEFQTAEAPGECATLSARRLTDLHRAARGSVALRRIADAIKALHIVHGLDLLGWLDEEREYEERVAANCPYLGQGHRRWLRYVRAEIDAALDALDRL